MNEETVWDKRLNDRIDSVEKKIDKLDDRLKIRQTVSSIAVSVVAAAGPGLLTWAQAHPQWAGGLGAVLASVLGAWLKARPKDATLFFATRTGRVRP